MNDPTHSTTAGAQELAMLRQRLAELEGVAAEYRQCRERLSEREASLHRILGDTEAGYFALDSEQCFRQVNPAWLRIHGYDSAEELQGKPLQQIVSEPSQQELQGHLKRLLNGEAIPSGELSVRRKDGSLGYVTFSAHAVLDQGQVVGIEGFVIDITERKRAEEQVRRSTRALRALSQCNRALVRAQEERELLQEVCGILVLTAGYRAAWVAYPGQEDRKIALPAAQCGFPPGHLEQLLITWDDTASGQGIIGTVLRTRQATIIPETEGDTRLEPWRSTVVGLGFVSCAALPLLSGKELLGALAIYAPESDAFDPAELELLSDLADNLAYGIRTLRMRKLHEVNQRALADSKGRLEALIQSLPDRVFLFDEQGYGFDALAGCGHASAGPRVEEVVPVAVADLALATIRQALRTQRTQIFEYAVEDLEGIQWFEGRITPVQGRIDGRLPVVWLARDITARKRAEETLRRSHAELEQHVQARTAELTAANVQLQAEISERARAEEASRKSQNRYRTLFEESPISIWEEDLSEVLRYFQQLRHDGVEDLQAYFQVHPEDAHRCLSMVKVVDVNHATLTMLGGECKEDMLDRLAFVIPPQSFEGMRERLVGMLLGQGNVETESVFRSLTGEMIPVALNVVVATDGEGDPQRILVSVLDITQRKQAEEAFQQEQRRLRQLLEVYEQHRRMIAYDIHDAVCQRLTAALMTLEACTRRLQKECSQITRAGFSHVQQLLQEGLWESRRLMSGLRPLILDESGLLAALEYLVCENQGVDGLEITFSHTGQFGRLAPPLETAIFRIVQEGLTNAQRHSQSKTVHIGLEQVDGRIRVEIEDWGQGFDPAQTRPDHFGLEGMRERTQLFGGTLTIDSQPHCGTRIAAELPLVEGDFRESEGEEHSL